MDTIFSNIEINQIFFESETGEYYSKVSDTEAHVFDMNHNTIYVDSKGAGIACMFPPNHPVELED